MQPVAAPGTIRNSYFTKTEASEAYCTNRSSTLRQRFGRVFKLPSLSKKKKSVAGLYSHILVRKNANCWNSGSASSNISFLISWPKARLMSTCWMRRARSNYTKNYTHGSRTSRCHVRTMRLGTGSRLL